jgi:hypothetical protein
MAPPKAKVEFPKAWLPVKAQLLTVSEENTLPIAPARALLPRPSMDLLLVKVLLLTVSVAE